MRSNYLNYEVVTESVIDINSGQDGSEVTTVVNKTRKDEQSTEETLQEIVISSEKNEKVRPIESKGQEKDKFKSNTGQNASYGVKYQVYSYPYPGGEPLNYTPEDRNGFVLRVMLLVFAMLLITGLICVAVYASPAREAMRRSALGTICLIVGVVLYLIVSYAMACTECARFPPMCYVMIVMVVIALTMVAVPIVCMYKLPAIMYAFIATACVVLACVGLACTNIDFTKFILIVAVASMALCFCGIAIMIARFAFNQHLTTLNMVLLGLQVIVSSVALIIELQMILGGKSVELTTDEWAYAAYCLYTSIIMLFLKLLQLIGCLSGGE